MAGSDLADTPPPPPLWFLCAVWAMIVGAFLVAIACVIVGLAKNNAAIVIAGLFVLPFLIWSARTKGPTKATLSKDRVGFEGYQIGVDGSAQQPDVPAPPPAVAKPSIWRRGVDRFGQLARKVRK